MRTCLRPAMSGCSARAAPVAQRRERWTSNPMVAGSIPAGGATPRRPAPASLNSRPDEPRLPRSFSLVAGVFGTRRPFWQGQCVEMVVRRPDPTTVRRSGADDRSGGRLLPSGMDWCGSAGLALDRQPLGCRGHRTGCLRGDEPSPPCGEPSRLPTNRVGERVDEADFGASRLSVGIGPTQCLLTLQPEFDDLLVAIRKIPERHRTALILRYYADLSVEQVATTMGCPFATAKSLIQRGLVQLRKELASDG